MSSFLYCPWVGDSVAALGGADDSPAVLDDLRRGRHPLDSLVEVLVKGISAVGRHDHVEWAVDLLHRRALGGATGGLVYLEEVARVDAGDLPVAVDRNVHA